MPLLRLTDASREVLCSYDWPGNGRELENTLYRACALANTSVLLPQDIPLQTTGTGKSEEALTVLALQAEREGTGLLDFLETEAVRYVRAVSVDDSAAAATLGISLAALKKRSES